MALRPINERIQNKFSQIANLVFLQDNSKQEVSEEFAKQLSEYSKQLLERFEEKNTSPKTQAVRNNSFELNGDMAEQFNESFEEDEY